MGDGLKLAHIAGALAAGALAFGAGVFFMVNQALDIQPAPPAPVAVALAAPPEPEPEPELVGPVAPPAAPAPKPVAPVAPVQNNAAVGDSGWTDKARYGLPDPRKLSAKEKAGLRMLGTADNTHTYKLNRIVLEDGSTIPAAPAPSSLEIRDRVVNPIKKLGLADGFEATVLDLAPRALDYLSVQTSETPEWSAVQPVLGKEDGSSEGDVWLRPATGRGTVYFRVAWFRYGWLEFGVGEGKVRVIKADMRHVDLVPAESVPGGRSAADPAKVAARKKTKPHRSPTEPPAEFDALKLFGKAQEVRIVRRLGTKDTGLEELVHKAQTLNGKDIFPGAVETARALKSSLKVQSISIVPSQNPAMTEIVDLLGDAFRTKPDSTTPSMTWHQYFWLEFGVVDGKVAKVRVNCMTAPDPGR